MASPVHTRQHLLNTRNEGQSRKSVTLSTHTSANRYNARSREDRRGRRVSPPRLLSVYGLIGLNVCATLTALWARGIFENSQWSRIRKFPKVGLAGKFRCFWINWFFELFEQAFVYARYLWRRKLLISSFLFLNYGQFKFLSFGSESKEK